MRSNEDIESAMEHYGDAVLSACLSYLGSLHQAEDAYQDTFVKYATSSREFANEEHRKAWLLRVAINVSKDMLKASSAKNLALDENHDAPEDGSDHGELIASQDELAKALGTLSDAQRQAIVLTSVVGYSAPEAASLMDLPLNTVYSHITRGKRALRKALEDV